MGELTYHALGRRRKPKGPTARYRAKRRRAEDPALTACRKHANRRDGACKLSVLGGCQGPTALMHLRPRTRAQTRGMPPAFRHSVEYTMNGCHRHHRLYDDHLIELAMFADLGANGPIRIQTKDRVVMVNQ